MRLQTASEVSAASLESAVSVRFQISSKELAKPKNARPGKRNGGRGRGRGKGRNKKTPGRVDKKMDAIRKRDRRRENAGKQESGVMRAGAAASSMQGAETRIREMRSQMKARGSTPEEASERPVTWSQRLFSWITWKGREMQRRESTDLLAANDAMMAGFSKKTAQSRLSAMKHDVISKSEKKKKTPKHDLFKSGSARTRIRNMGGRTQASISTAEAPPTRPCCAIS